MSLSERLQIILITYNRERQLRKTLAQLFSPSSPVRDFNITILDNKSTDGTPHLIAEYQKEHRNLKHIRHSHNVGGNANIAKAIEMVTYDYGWIICDDDDYHWEAWPEVEAAIAQNSALICVANHIIKPQYRNCEEYLLYQMTFLPSIIFSKQVLTDVAIRNAYDCVFHLFPHLAPVIAHFNDNGHVAITDHSLVSPGKDEVIFSYTRGHTKDEIFPRARTMTFFVGYANALLDLRDKNIRHFFATIVNGDSPNCVGWWTFFKEALFVLDSRKQAMHFCDLLSVSPAPARFILRLIIVLQHIGLVQFYLFILSHFRGTTFYWFLRRNYDRFISHLHKHKELFCPRGP